MKIFISVGHGGADSGATGINGIKESSLTLDLSNAIAEVLKYNGIEYMLSRTFNVDNPQAEKISQINSYNPTFMFDIHFNAYDGTATGTEVYYQHDVITSKSVATKVSAAVSSYLGISNRGPKQKLLSSGEDYFGMLRNCKCPAILLETCFIDSQKDMKNIISNKTETFKGIARAIVKAFCEDKGIKYKDPTSAPVPAPTPTPTPSNGQKFKIGDKVVINGLLYSNSNAANAVGSVKNKTTEITRYAAGAKHPYNTTGDLGWIDEASISLVSSTSQSKPQSNTTIMKVTPSVGLWLQNSNKVWNSSTRILCMPKGAKVTVYKGTESKLGSYTSVKVNYNGTIGYCAKDYLK